MASTTDPASACSPAKRSKNEQARVLLWCTQRSSATVLSKCLSFVPDSEILFDAYSIVVAAEMFLKLAGKGKVIDHDNDNLTKDEWRKLALSMIEAKLTDDQMNVEMLKYSHIKKILENPDPSKSLIFCKGMTPLFEPKDFRFLPDKSSNYKHTFLIRHPAKLFTSWRKAIYDLITSTAFGDGSGTGFTKPLKEFDVRRDISEIFGVTHLIYKQIFDLWKHVRENLDPNPVVMESDDLLADPAGMLSKYCKAVGIPYSDDLLTWDESPDITDSWKHVFQPIRKQEVLIIFIKKALNSDRFIAPTPVPDSEDLSEDVKELVDLSMPFYKELIETKLMP